MAITLLLDANLDGHGELLRRRLESDPWRYFCDHLAIEIIHFEDLKLDRKAKDTDVWQTCQAHGCYLLTANRNEDDPDSLEATLKQFGTAESLPVFTFADANRIYDSVAYLDRVIDRLLVYLLDEPNCRGTGRLYRP